MPHICPRPCSRLATAAVYLSVGVVQLVVGIILLRSKYVFLLAGPDFWTALSNIAVGCLLGVSASVWKDSKKRQASKHFIRRNLLLALLFSAFTVNSTTLAILLMGEGNTLLSIRLESKGVTTSTHFVNEVLAYAYATSICAPIVCIVVSIVAMSGVLFRLPTDDSTTDLKTPKSTLPKEQQPESLLWVYTPELLGLGKRAKKVSSHSSESSSDATSDDSRRSRPKFIHSVEDLQSVLNHMALGKRDSILSDSTIMLQQLDRRRKELYNSIALDPHNDSILARARKAALSERSLRKDSSGYGRSPYSRSQYSYRKFNGNGNASRSRESSAYVPIGPLSRFEKPRQSSSPYFTDDVFNEYHNASKELSARNLSNQYRKRKDDLKSQSEVKYARFKRGPDDRQRLEEPIAVHKSPRLPNGFSTENSFSRDLHENREQHASSNRATTPPKKKIIPYEAKSGCFSPEDSDFADSFELSGSSSWAGEVIPIEVKNPTSRLPSKLVPVQPPVVPKRLDNRFQKRSDDAETSEESLIESQETTVKEPRNSLSPFRENKYNKLNGKQNGFEYPKVGSKYDGSRVIPMTSISEEPSSEADKTSESPQYPSYQEDSSSSSNSQTTSYNISNRLSPAAFSEATKSRYQERASPGKVKTPKRKTGASCKSLKRIWSSAGTERDMDILEKVVDEDSLIGLSEEELIARQTRTRSIRKVVEQRIKGQGMEI